MSRIVKRILMITIAIVALIFIMFAAANIISISNVLKKATDDKVFYEASKFSNQISMIFENAEGTVDAMRTEVMHNFDISRQKKDPTYVKRYMRQYARVIKDTLVDIEDSQGLFLTFNPEITDKLGAYEIWYSYDSNGTMVNTDAMSNGVYQEAFDEDYPGMQYYFEAVKQPDRGVWTEPHMDPDINETIITYSRAVYSKGELIGVVGTDIATKHTTDLISDMKVEHGGMIVLLDHNNNQIIASSNAQTTGLLKSKPFWKEIKSQLNGRDDGIFSANWEKESMKIGFSKLSNDWKLAIINYESKLYAPYNNIIFTILVLSVIFIVLLAIIIYFAVKHFSSPVDKAINLLNMMELKHLVGREDTSEIKNDDDIEALVKKAAERQRMSDIMLANQSKLVSVGEMMANVTHQWKQPLNNINIVMGNLKDDIVNDSWTRQDGLRAVEKVEGLTTSMSETLNDFSGYLKPDTKSVVFHVNDVICAVLELVKDKIQAQNIAVSVNGDTDLFSYGYKNSLYHVLLNVIKNAIEATGETGGIIEITTKRVQPCNGKISIEIYNNGAQMSEAAREHLFEPYYTTKEKKGGTGLGLAISKYFIESSMDGEISLENYHEGVKCTIIINEKECDNDR